MKTYEETVQRLGRQAYDKYMQGSWETWPDGVSTVAWIYGKDTGQVEQDILECRDALITAQVKGHKKRVQNEQNAADRMVAQGARPAYYDQEGGSMCNGIGREYF